MTNPKPLTIGIIGAGFSGTAAAAYLYRYLPHPLKIILFEKRGKFARGEAYSTPYPYHILNVRAHDMSAFEDKPNDFVDWLKRSQYPLDLSEGSIAEQFVPRLLYGRYLESLMLEMLTSTRKDFHLQLERAEVVDIKETGQHMVLSSQQGKRYLCDKVILAMGNYSSAQFPFPVSSAIRQLVNPWDFTAPATLNKQDAVLIVGTGLSMIDAVLTLYHHGHQGKIYALSRHGLLPLPHKNHANIDDIAIDRLPKKISSLFQFIRQQAKENTQQGHDWRAVIQAIRHIIPEYWRSLHVAEKEKFFRHINHYWNIHRHRVHAELADILTTMQNDGQLEVLAGRVKAITDTAALIKLRGKGGERSLAIQAVINCMGPVSRLQGVDQPLVYSLLQQGIAKVDETSVGFNVEKGGKISNRLYALGPLARGVYLATSSVPEIRKQCFALIQEMLV